MSASTPPRPSSTTLSTTSSTRSTITSIEEPYAGGVSATTPTVT
jgi:hypothetical protein